jgi:hypothetical protein
MKRPSVDDKRKPASMGLKCLCGKEVYFYMVRPGKFHFDCDNPECLAVTTVEHHGRRKAETDSTPLRLVK